MPGIFIRDIPESILKQLKIMAKRHNRSLQQELKAVLTNLTSYSFADISKKALTIRKKLKKKGISFTDSAELLREDRSR